MHVFGHTSVENRQGGLEDWRPELRQSPHQPVMDDLVPVRLTLQPEHWLDGFGRLQVGEQAHCMNRRPSRAWAVLHLEVIVVQEPQQARNRRRTERQCFPAQLGVEGLTSRREASHRVRDHVPALTDPAQPARVSASRPTNLVSTAAMPRLKRPHVASMEEVRITREGDAAVIEYADESVATTNFGLGAAKLATMTDEDVLEAWNDCLRNMEAHRRSIEYVATEILIGKPQVKFFARGDQWVPRGGVLRCQILSDGGIEPSLDEPFVAIDDRDFTLAEFMKMIGTHGGWGMRIEFVPDDELHVRPKLKVREPPRGKKK